ncbi:MAG TPA: hypothetical protein VMM58_02420 [Bacteroidota bacterium]|nr:hypothetical protein [Bacteroidota bacterium]
MENESQEKVGLQWKWIAIGTIIGVVLTTFLFQIMSDTFNSFYIPLFIGLLSFVIMGIIIGYKSPGYTLKEPAIGGVFAVLITIGILHYVFDYNPPEGQMIAAPFMAFVLALIGGWVGEELQGSQQRAAENKTIAGLEWAWVITGTVVGFILNNIFVYGLFALMRFGVAGILISLGASFIVAGIIVGYKSPGVTIKEAALAGVLGVILNFFFIYFGFGAMLDMEFLIIGLIGGFILSFVGGWIGEEMQKRKERTAK